MLTSQFLYHIRESATIDGDIVDFRIYDGVNFLETINIEALKHKHFIGHDTFTGLNVPSSHDLLSPNKSDVTQHKYASNELDTRNLVSKNSKYHNYTIHKTDYKDLNNHLYSFAIIDLKQYIPTKTILNHVWDNISHGGTIWVSHYEESKHYAHHKAIKEFIEENQAYLEVSRQMLINNVREKYVAIKCYNPKFKKEIIKKEHEKITIAMVLKTGGEVYDYKYVNALARSIKANITIDHELVCLTDNSYGFSSDVDRVIPFTHNYPKWWGKVELFDGNKFNTNKIFYFDLDTVIIDNIDHMLNYHGIFTGLRDLYNLYSFGSGVMGWDKKYTQNIYTDFLPISEKIMMNYRAGDQEWINEKKPSIDYIQDMFPKEIVSFKRHCFINNQIIIPDKAKIICFHGNPRPHTIDHPILKQYWE